MSINLSECIERNWIQYINQESCVVFQEYSLSTQEVEAEDHEFRVSLVLYLHLCRKLFLKNNNGLSLKVCIALTEDSSPVPKPTLGSLQPHVTPELNGTLHG